MKNEAKWTPGPWEYQEGGSRILDSGKGSSQVLVAIIAKKNRKDEGRHNARLIAAAPELYDELCKARHTIQALIDDGYMGYVDFRSSIDAALAKARGEQP